MGMSRRMFLTVYGSLWLLLLLSRPGVSKPQLCQTCQNLVTNVLKGIEKTAGLNFGGGNTAWEEEKLSKYEISETRLLEVIETACDKSDFDCNKMLEQNEEHMESWWFKKQKEQPDLFQWLCMDTLRLCCPKGRFGADCLSCPGGTEKPCSGNGQCNGDGTRFGTGVCDCYTSYGGPVCMDCALGYYEQARNESHLNVTELAASALGPGTISVCCARGAGYCMMGSA